MLYAKKLGPTPLLYPKGAENLLWTLFDIFFGSHIGLRLMHFK